MQAISEWTSNLGTQIADVAVTLGNKVEKLADDYKVSEKLNAIGDKSEEQYHILSGAYRKIVTAYLTSLANGSPPDPLLLNDSFTFVDENGARDKNFITSPLTYQGRQCAGSVEIFADGAQFGFKMTQTIEFAPGFQLASGRAIGGKRAENVTTFGVVHCQDGTIFAHQQRGDSLDTWKFL